MSTPSHWLIPHWPGLPDNVGALSTTRRGGVSPAPYDDGMGGGGLNLGTHVGDQPHNVARNRDILRALLPGAPAWLSQVHGTTVVDVARIGLQDVPEADASFSVAPGKPCVIMTADCLPVLFCDVEGKTVGAAHAGWRGLAAGVLENTVKSMRAAGAGELMAWMGPAIGAYQFEVGQEVKQAFLTGALDASGVRHVEAAFSLIDGKPGKYMADIYGLARYVLHRAGVMQVHGGEFCTVSNSGRFYSYRRDGVTGRQAALIWIK
ncbi:MULTISPECIES: peptidoglycan editing factor PgeF [unclassified Duganella]|uniref:peptidoglycan editing factor PgeF n=1 Tax=unclassified Duganella TaxID=2636909 RepID=UPI000E341AD2|nr:MULTISPECIES: peptidoglycan editing factor PgeF [unclassified Duganella]RFP13797.1 peptidoglycan editing factor PgeF [Duganella sp. BJB475]RFP36505.1 peptidoglycan editing factor PgeF [Duganella sp. BJB476]